MPLVEKRYDWPEAKRLHSDRTIMETYSEDRRMSHLFRPMNMSSRHILNSALGNRDHWTCKYGLYSPKSN